MNEEQYQALGSPPLESQDVGFQLRTASGALMPGMGFLTCDLGIGGRNIQATIHCLPTANSWNYFGVRFPFPKSTRDYMGTRGNIAIKG